MSTTLYAYSPRPREGVAVEMTAAAGEACTIRVSWEGSSLLAGVPDAKVPEVAREILRAMHEAAGLPVPIVLERQTEHTFRSWYKIDRRAPGSVLINPEGPLSYSGARRFAAALAGAVERAEGEPDPAEVEALARVILSELLAGPTAAEGAARAILARWTLTERQP